MTEPIKVFHPVDDRHQWVDERRPRNDGYVRDPDPTPVAAMQRLGQVEERVQPSAAPLVDDDERPLAPQDNLAGLRGDVRRPQEIQPRAVEQRRPLSGRAAAQAALAKRHIDELKVNFLARYAGQDVKTILVVGTARGDGASTVAQNFAASLAQDTDRQVLFVNADTHPAEKAGRRKAPDPVAGGLAVLAQPGSSQPMPVQLGSLHVMPSGLGLSDPATFFQSKRFNAFISEMTPRFDYIVIDGPPLDDAPESLALSASVDGVILVLDAQRTRRKTALRAKKRIEDLGGKVVGVVLNRREYYVPKWLYRRI